LGLMTVVEMVPLLDLLMALKSALLKVVAKV
jgi:hypothetical protein